jgi:hypothetical protein
MSVGNGFIRLQQKVHMPVQDITIEKSQAALQNVICAF